MRAPQVVRRHLTWGLVAAFLAMSAVACRPTATPPSVPAPMIGGIQINEPRLSRWIDTLKKSGLNTVSTTVYAKQADWDSAVIASEAKIAPVRAEIAAAKAAGFQVVLILRVALDHAFPRNRFLWHGMISPQTDEQVDAWFDAYTAYVLKWARVAQEEGVDVFGLGSELNRLTSTRKTERQPDLEQWYLDTKRQADFRQKILSFGPRITAEHRAAEGGGDFSNTADFLDARFATWRAWAEQVTFKGAPNPLAAINARRAHHERRWRRLIRDVRKVYRGKLTYAANFDQFEEVSFWDELDLIGVNAYFELRRGLQKNNLVEQLTTSWREVFTQIERFRTKERLQIPVLFTELGYTNRQHSTIKPWAQSGFEIVDDELVVWQDQPASYSERVRALDALHQVSACEFPNLLSGLLYWKLSSWPDQQPIEPFAIILNQDDPAQASLLRFLLPPTCPKERFARAR